MLKASSPRNLLMNLTTQAQAMPRILNLAAPALPPITLQIVDNRKTLVMHSADGGFILTDRQGDYENENCYI